jgi:hypothetical protein
MSLRISIGSLIASGRMHPSVSREIMIWLGCYEYIDPSKQCLYSDLTEWILEDCRLWCSRNPNSIYSMSPHSYLQNAVQRIEGICPYFSAEEQASILEEIMPF